jgi:hypothetical protein
MSVILICGSGFSHDIVLPGRGKRGVSPSLLTPHSPDHLFLLRAIYLPFASQNPLRFLSIGGCCAKFTKNKEGEFFALQKNNAQTVLALFPPTACDTRQAFMPGGCNGQALQINRNGLKYFL